MSIEIGKLASTRPELRTADVPVPDLAGLPGVDEDSPTWKVRMLTGEDLDRAAGASDRGAVMIALAEKMAGDADGQANALLEAMGIAGKDVPEETKRAYDFLVAGSVDPAIDRQQAIWLYKYFPIVAKMLTRKIMELTGLGADMGKSSRSGKRKKSEPRLSSDNSTTAASLN